MDRLKANAAANTGATVPNSNLLVLSISSTAAGTTSGQKIVVTHNITKDRNLSSTEELG
jgi:hypothetical protein